MNSHKWPKHACNAWMSFCCTTRPLNSPNLLGSLFLLSLLYSGTCVSQSSLNLRASAAIRCGDRASIGSTAPGLLDESTQVAVGLPRGADCSTGGTQPTCQPGPPTNTKLRTVEYMVRKYDANVHQVTSKARDNSPYVVLYVYIYLSIYPPIRPSTVIRLLFNNSPYQHLVAYNVLLHI
jgi:hypothetical protein